MQRKTYLQHCLHNGRVSRWPAAMMPLSVYIAPFRWYKAISDHDAYTYRQMVLDALNTWQNVTNGAVSFNVANSLNNSHINLEWKRVDRRSLGQCHFNYDNAGRFYSAELQIGLSDGVLHHQYMDEGEVYHTIIHEIGHALGLGHSPYKEDIMYTPHQYGVTGISSKDIQTLKWLYKFDIGLSENEILAKYPQLKTTNIDDLTAFLMGEKTGFESVKEVVEHKIFEKDLLQENENIGDLKKYLLQINNNFIVKKPKKD